MSGIEHLPIELLPHKYPFLLIDRVVEVEPGKRIVALKNISRNEPQFSGHFPDRPIMPGVLLCESMAQAGGMRRMPSTSTKQVRQAPAGSNRGSWQSVGISIPALWATSRIVSPGRISRP